jgi:S-DNA-T family DNA segregation ATPase FtsK/SpoIIIE
MGLGAANDVSGVLRLPLVVDFDQRSEDLIVEAPAAMSAGDVLAEIATAVGVAPSVPALCSRTGRRIDPSDAIGAAGLIRGDRIVLGTSTLAEPESSSSAWELVVTGGPAAGSRFALHPGRHTVGRDGEIQVDDAALSAQHLIFEVGESRVLVEDAGSSNGTALEGVALPPGQPSPLTTKAIVRAGRSLFSVEPIGAGAPPRDAAPDGSVPFNRQPRVNPPFTPKQFKLGAPPNAAQRSRLPLAAALMPVVIGVVLFFIIKNPAMFAFVALSPLMVIGSYVEDRRSGKGAYRQGLKEFRSQLAALRVELDSARADEATSRRAASPPLPELLRRANRHDPRLWERRPNDNDFLLLRLGSASLPSSISLAVAPGGEDEIRAEADRLAEWYELVPDVPVTAALTSVGVLGLAGSVDRVHASASSLVIQAATLHSPAEVRICAALGEAVAQRWDWLKWLPHCRMEDGPAIAVGRAATADLLDALLRLQQERTARDQPPPSGTEAHAVVVLIDEDVAPDRSTITPLLRRGSDAGIYVIWLGSRRTALPGETGAIAEFASDSARMTYTLTASSEVNEDVTGDGLVETLAQTAALALAPVDDTSAASAASRIPARVNLLDAIDLPEIDGAAVAARWESAEGLGATIGATGDGRFQLDLRRDGPHGLVAGTTGAGKSELLQTLVASLALEHPPNRLTFLLVDYKGGAAFKDCVRLPHTVGFVTDLDEHLTQRALVSLEAELRRREAILRDAGARDLMELERSTPSLAPPALLIVIDEFATLAKDVPDFVAGVVDVAQRGRSLGVHLLLATQSPSGVVTKDIRANTNLKIALRVSGPNESQDVLDVSDAATIPRSRPGRGIARTGHAELTPFQSAYVGGLTTTTNIEVSVRPFSLADKESVAAAVDGSGLADDTTDLDRIVDACLAAAAAQEIEPPRRPWLEPLPGELWFGDLAQPQLPAAAAVGLIDDPARQTQYPLVVDLAETGSLLIYGGAGSGKTTLLRTLTCALAGVVGVDALHVYGLDFGGHGLRALESLPHCGSVIPGDDRERCERLFASLQRTISERRDALAEARAFTVEELAQMRGEPVPRILVLLDGYTNFVSAFERVNYGALLDGLPRLVADGRTVGVHFAITMERRAGISSALSSAVPTKLVLRMPSEDDYGSLGFDPRATRGLDLAPGRGLTGATLEFQAAAVSRDPAPEAQLTSIEAIGRALSEREANRQAPEIRNLPTVVARGELPSAQEPLTAVLGLADSTLAPFFVDLRDRHFLVAGPYRSGRSATLRTIAEELLASTPGVRLYLLAPRPSPLPELGIWTSVARGAEECATLATELQAIVEASGGSGEPIVIVLDDGDELTDGLAGPTLETIVRRGRDRGVRVVASAERTAARAFSGWPRALRRDEYGLLLQPDDSDSGTLNVVLPRRTGGAMPPGRGYVVSRGAVDLVQVASPAEG